MRTGGASCSWFDTIARNNNRKLRVTRYAQNEIYDGAPANKLWLETEKDIYCFKYNHGEDCIEVLQGSSKGPIIKTFDNSNTLQDVKHFFEGL